ncbi:MAG: VCBS repeat-containing protein [Myxococcales bacterium]|nr:VCBS repeat-containing protein [Myxococcales bacterium]
MHAKHWGFVAIALTTACGSAGVSDDGFGPGGLPPGGTDGSTEGTAGDETGDGTAGGGDCEDGAACEGGVCVGGACCPGVQACGTVCCAGAEVCSFGACVLPDGACESSDDCAPDYYCEQGLGQDQEPDPGCFGGGTVGGFCLPLPPVCEGDEPPGPGGLPTCVQACDVVPDASDLSTVVHYEVDGPGYTAPVVIQLDDDDCDGLVTERDVPEIVWNMHTGASYSDPTNGRIKAVSIIDGAVVEKLSYDSVLPLSQIAAGDIDGDHSNGNEVVACASSSSVVALRFDGSVKWQAGPSTCGTTASGSDFAISVPNIADLDGDGVPEVITERAILDGATGATEATLSLPAGVTVAVSDVTGDGMLDIVSGGEVYDRNGVLVASMGTAGLRWPAIGDLDGDGVPEIVAVRSGNRTLSVWHVIGGMPEVVRSGLSLDSLPQPACPAGSAGNAGGGGPPTIGDFDGDNTPDVALAAGNAYVVFDGRGVMDPMTAAADTVLWASPTNDCSSAQTGSTLFDFDGNGRVEVVYGDEDLLRIYDGLSGTILSEHPHDTGTINEYPVVADVDADGQADIVAITRETCGNEACGVLRVYGSATGGWVRTRRVWNQYTYHVTNVSDDGTIPAAEVDNWTQPGLNNFRQNKQPGGEFSAGDAAVTMVPACFGGYSLQATVRNLGQAPIPAGATVTFFAGDPPGGEVLGELQTTITLYPAQSQPLVLPLDGPPQTTSVYATVSSNVPECDLDNNASEPADPTCIPAG